MGRKKVPAECWGTFLLLIFLCFAHDAWCYQRALVASLKRCAWVPARWSEVATPGRKQGWWVGSVSVDNALSEKAGAYQRCRA